MVAMEAEALEMTEPVSVVNALPVVEIPMPERVAIGVALCVTLLKYS